MTRRHAIPVAADLVGLHRRNNRESAPLGAGFADHRSRVTALALEPREDDDRGGSLAVRGAGNCNDLDLAACGGRFPEVHLVDLDGEALERARSRQNPEVAARLVLHAPVDLTGAFGRLADFRGKPATPQELAVLPARSVASVLEALPDRHDVVLSTCLLSQILQSAYVALGAEHPQLHLLACALALAHLRSVTRMLKPGGTAHLVTDAVSTETYPLVELWESRPPQALLEELERTGNVFSGTGPAFLRRILATDREVAPELAGPPRLHQPWLWHFSADRSYLVYALSFRRRPGR